MSPLGPAMPLVTYFASIGIWMFDFSSTRAEDLDGSPQLGSWNCLSAWYLASQETSTKQLEGCVA